MLPPEKVELLAEMLRGLSSCQCLSPAEEHLVQGLARLIQAGKPKLLFPPEFNTVRSWQERCATCRQRKG
jgi:hypothetical protein